VKVSALYEERYWYPDDGGIVWLAGYALTDPDTGDFLARNDPKLADRGLRVMNVAGARFHDEALQSDAAAPGRRLVLRAEPDNPHDPNAIAVDTEEGLHLGFVPRDVDGIDSSWSAVSLRESRASPRDPRTGLTMLLAAAPEVLLG
jgi:HIRAN domain